MSKKSNTYEKASYQLRSKLAAQSGTQTEDWYLVFKARYAMHCVFETLAQVHPRKPNVLTQLFTCSTAVTPILAAGLNPRYGHLDYDTFALGRGQNIDASYGSIVIQHTFGIFNDEKDQSLASQAREAGALIIEDNAHCLARIGRDQVGNVLADISVHSFGVEKMLPTKFGGAIWVNPELAPEFRESLVRRLTSLPVLPRRLDWATKNYRNTLRVVNRIPGGLGKKIRLALERVNLFEPAVAQVEGQGRLAHPSYLPSSWIVEQAVSAFSQLEKSEAQRAAAVSVYRKNLANVIQIPKLQADQSLVRFPVITESQEQAQNLRKHLLDHDVYAGLWYNIPLFPGVDEQQYGIDVSDAAQQKSIDMMKRVINLPTNVSAIKAQEITDLVQAYLSHA